MIYLLILELSLLFSPSNGYRAVEPEDDPEPALENDVLAWLLQGGEHWQIGNGMGCDGHKVR